MNNHAYDIKASPKVNLDAMDDDDESMSPNLLFLLLLGAVLDLLSVVGKGDDDVDDGNVAELVLPMVVFVKLLLSNENRSEAEEDVYGNEYGVLDFSYDEFAVAECLRCLLNEGNDINGDDDEVANFS
ncbi:hypothetical protein MAM1_0936c11372 [Mucor ambiguus]|uniref:Uncharacterized protein n=1 Tax=Mucor ambiguus TaxID=91626 RepID=A0A0C9MM04_9FUNG|nr:hypothetical protein MAM1_0936c11372 [Mucor ambiguus]